MRNGRKELEDRCAVVVGAGSMGEGWGNGMACAVADAREGAAVVCVDHVEERAAATAAIIADEGGRALALQADATNEKDLTQVVTRALSTFGQVDVMHNNVGAGGSFGAPDKISPEEWDREIAISLNTAYLGTRCVVSVMREQGRGVITNVSSLLAVRFLRRPSVAYTASKAAVEAMTRACAVAYGAENIRVNCLRIGFSETPLLRSGVESSNLSRAEIDKAMERSRSKVPLRREHTDPLDVAAAAVFLACDGAKHITGQILNIDGGLECAAV